MRKLLLGVSLVAMAAHAAVIAEITPARSLKGHRGAITAVSFSGDGSAVASVGIDGTVRVWRVADGTEIAVVTDLPVGLTAVALAPDASVVVYGTAGGEVRALKLPKGEEVLKLSRPEAVASLSFDATGRHLAISGSSPSKPASLVVAFPSGSVEKSLAGTPVVIPTQAPAFLFAAAKAITRLGFEAKEPRRDVPFLARKGEKEAGPAGHVFASDATGNLVASFSRKNPVITVQSTLRGGPAPKTFDTEARTLSSVALSADGTLLIAGSSDGPARLWNVTTGEEVRQYSAPHGFPVFVAFQPGPAQYVVTTNISELRLWNTPGAANAPTGPASPQPLDAGASVSK